MNNEPVAYFRKNYDGDWVEAEAGYEDESIPLYTHPANLTDEEIYEIWFHHGYRTPFTENINRFARAILRKAQGK